MAFPLRTALSSSLRQRSGVVPSSYAPAASFASSSRIGLDFTRPSFAEQRTTLLDSSTGSSPSTTAPSPSAQPSSSSPAPTPNTPRTPNYGVKPPPSPFTPTFSLPSSSTPSAAPELSSRQSAKLREKTHRGRRLNIPVYSPIEDPTTNPRGVTHIFQVQSTRNNVHLDFCDGHGNVFGGITGGTGGTFKKSNRSTYEAAHQAALKMFERILAYSREHKVQVCVAFKGILGTGRDAVAAAISGPEGQEFRSLIVRLEDRTPVKIGGDRPRGKRNT